MGPRGGSAAADGGVAMGAAGTAFASDFDGTLCDSDWNTGVERYDAADIEAVRRYQESGGLFGICTGRPLTSVQESLAGIIDLDFYIVTTGAQVLAADLTPFLDKELGRELAEELHARYGGQDGMYTVVVTDGDFVSVDRPMSDRMGFAETIGDVAGRVLGVSFECMGDEDWAHRIAADINERYAGVLAAFQNLGSVDVVCAGCSKGEGARRAKEGLGVRLIAGIGDSYNDLALLEAADVAYTFHKAPAEVRAVADRVVSSVAEALGDFVARA